MEQREWQKMTKNVITIYTCDYCAKKIKPQEATSIHLESTSAYGPSGRCLIVCNGIVHAVKRADFCDIKCFKEWLLIPSRKHIKEDKILEVL